MLAKSNNRIASGNYDYDLDFYLSKLRLANPSEAIKLLEEYSKHSETWASNHVIQNTNRQRLEGIYYTGFNLARAIVNSSLQSFAKPPTSFLEPCVGGGAFLFTYVDEAFKRTSGSASDLQRILNGCYFADADPSAVARILKIAPHYFEARYGFNAAFPKENARVGNSLAEFFGAQKQLQPLTELFGKTEGFDLVITNPPYKLLKKDRRHSNVQDVPADAAMRADLNLDSFRFLQGTPNIYKLFVEAIIESWVHKNGVIGLLVPQSLLKDAQSEKLRNNLLETFEITMVAELDEGTAHFSGVGQAFVALTAKNGGSTSKVRFGEFDDTQEIFHAVSELELARSRKISKSSAVFQISESQFDSLSKLADFQTVGDLDYLVNLRGEYDVSLDSNYLTKSEESSLALLQGIHIGSFEIKPSDKFVSEEFLNRPKGRWVKAARLACQQISNKKQKKRLKWALVPSGYVLANSCNFISIESSAVAGPEDEHLHALLGILNSKCLEDRFNAFSPNNHVSNREINDLPVGDLTSKTAKDIAKLVMKMTSSPSELELESLENLVLEHFGLESEKLTNEELT